ncbi:OmpA family protein [Halochromatium salexigens]|uniref:OmpA family protein n=1 Tax=Halochromatium salexigens TaxID=49447 RepID=UPI001913EEE7
MKPSPVALIAACVACATLLFAAETIAGFYDGSAAPDADHAPSTSFWGPEPSYGNCWEDPSRKRLPECGAVRVPEQLTVKLLFEFDEYIVPDTVVNRWVIATLDSYIDKVTRSPAREYITIIGHTDAKGADDYNMALGMRRAKAVHDYFIAQGYPASLLAPPESRGERELLPQYSPLSVEQRRVVINKVDR